MKPTIIYISSDNRSGSTLLDQLLGSNPKIASVGEIVHLDAYVREDRSIYNPRHPLVCSCGQRLAECPFWTSVASAAGRPLDQFGIGIRPRRLQDGSLSTRLRRRVLNVLKGPLVSLNRVRRVREFTGAAEVGRESFALFDAIGEASGTEFIVDSSKDPYRFLSLYGEQPDRVKVILLARDYRGVVYSKMKRGMPLENAIRGWTKRLKDMRRMTRLMPPHIVTRVTYEDLCLNPEDVMRRLCEFVGTPFAPSMLVRHNASKHGLGGSPSKFDTTRQTISMDLAHLDAFSAAQLSTMKLIAGREAERWGYVDR